jgi:hypothetical protein
MTLTFLWQKYGGLGANMEDWVLTGTSSTSSFVFGARLVRLQRRWRWLVSTAPVLHQANGIPAIPNAHGSLSGLGACSEAKWVADLFPDEVNTSHAKDKRHSSLHRFLSLFFAARCSAWLETKVWTNLRTGRRFEKSRR